MAWQTFFRHFSFQWLSKYFGTNDNRFSFSSGRLYPDHDLHGMLSEATGPLNFTQFLAILGDKIIGQDKEEVIKAAFKTFDTNDTGKVNAKVLRKALMTWGEKLTDEEIEEALKDAPIDSKGNVDILQYVKTIAGSKEEDY